ncbi:hypothetical protein M4I32_01540 [Microbacterium sp. LRZ72]|uniref:hypothetical protein n=1 Tax=Microbacterium sp. LRZ72 TaxID=2942481 RepID=UPI0029B1BA72|nr:hypothetical protein [Microbacterium sp. LRZ72]MDX2375482.1 hypothetical protein [Microbacterium sp. LRZ72]
MNRGRSLRVLGIILLICVCSSIVGAVVVLVVPQVWASASTTVSDHETIVSLDSGQTTVEVPVPAGWALRPEGSTRAVLTMPDGEHRVTFALQGDAGAVETVRDVASGAPGTWSEEALGSGVVLHHTRTDAGERAGVVIGPRGAVAFVLARLAPDGRLIAGVEADAELAKLLAAIEMAQ